MSPPPDVEPSPPLSYATPAPPRGGGHWPAAILMLGGLGLIALGGCFCIGVLVTLNTAAFFTGPNGGTPRAMTPGAMLFLVVLYAAAFACFTGAATLIVPAARRLLRG